MPGHGRPVQHHSRQVVWLATLSAGVVAVYGRSVATFVIETYLSRARGGELEGSTARLREVIDRESRERRVVRLVRAFYVADDEIAYYIVEAASRDVADDLARDAGLRPERILPVASPGR